MKIASRKMSLSRETLRQMDKMLRPEGPVASFVGIPTASCKPYIC